MTPNKCRLKRQRSTPKHQKSPRTPKHKIFQSPTNPVSIISGGSPQFSWQSQEVHDGVTWDCRSPMQQKLRSAKKHGKTNVTDLLKCINHEVEKRQKTSLLDTWLSTGQRIISPIQYYRRKSPESKKRRLKLQKIGHPRHLAKELQELSEAINKNDNPKGGGETRLLCESPHLKKTRNFKATTTNKLCVINSISNFESSEELWGTESESFLIQATQAIEQAEDEYVNKQSLQTTSMSVSNINKECLSIKDQILTEGHKIVPFIASGDGNIKGNKNLRDIQIAESSDNKNMICEIDTMENFWESDSSFDEILSSLPYDELAEKTCVKESAENCANKNSSLNQMSLVTCHYSPKNVSENKLKKSHQNKSLYERHCKTNNNNKCLILSDKKSSLLSAMSSMNLQANTIEWESDEFDAVVMQTEILKALEQAESEALGSQKCTPEEIERKKAEALERRRKNRLNTYSMMPKIRKQDIWRHRLRSKTDISKYQK